MCLREREEERVCTGGRDRDRERERESFIMLPHNPISFLLRYIGGKAARIFFMKCELISFLHLRTYGILVRTRRYVVVLLRQRSKVGEIARAVVGEIAN